jgi:hypothetical protein
MTDDHPAIPYDRVPRPEPARDDEVDVLIGRLIDGEATTADRTRFDGLAAREPRLWRDLALRHQDMPRLADAFELEAGAAAEAELPSTRSGRRRAGGVRWGLAVSGWAALLLVGIGWIVTAVGRPPVSVPPTGIPTAEPGAAALSADEHFDRYLAAQNVLGEYEPLVLEVKEMTDGRVAVRYMRRIEEVAIVDSLEDLPVSDDGHLTVPPAELRHTVPAERSPD